MTLLSPSFKVRHLILAAALTTGPGFVNPANAEIAFLVDLNSRTAIALGTLGGGESNALGINDAEQVAGYSPTYFLPAGGNSNHAFITGPDGEGMMDLNSLVDLPQGVILSQAIDINNRGQVIANAIATTIPEPESYALMLAGLGLVGFIARRKKMENLKRY